MPRDGLHGVAVECFDVTAGDEREFPSHSRALSDNVMRLMRSTTLRNPLDVIARCIARGSRARQGNCASCAGMSLITRVL